VVRLLIGSTLGDSLRGGVNTGTFCNGTKVTLNVIPEAGLTPNDIIATNCPAIFARGNHLPALDAILKFHPIPESTMMSSRTLSRYEAVLR
jgi:hypothetical protein